MSAKLKAVRGTQDLLGEPLKIFTLLVDTAKRISSLYGFNEINTPIFESVDVFKRTLGDVSDIVNKEMYVFTDRGGELICLRPEFTAGIARALISGSMLDKLPLKLFSSGPVFRYERPQKGRKRQFHQLNFEIFGIKETLADVELISMACHFLKEVGIDSKVSLEINSLGDQESRALYRTAIIDYFSRYKNDLSEDSKLRLQKNPLRILDSKDNNDKKIVLDAPVISDYYTDISKKLFYELQEGLENLNITYKINTKLVRGLDYYCHSVFEFITNDLVAQNAVLAGGRYDLLVSLMGGKDTPAVGFAGGLERLISLYNNKIDLIRPVTILPLGTDAQKEAINIANKLRYSGIYTEIIFSGGNISKKMKKSNNLNSSFTIILGDNEIKKNIVIVKNMDSSMEKEISKENLISYLDSCR